MNPDLSTISTAELEATAVDLEVQLRDDLSTPSWMRDAAIVSLDAVRSELARRARRWDVA
jgi:hypothetical protein